MSAHTQITDQHWRIRGLDAPVELRLAPQVSGLGRVKEASLHGAFVETGASLKRDAHLAVRPIPEAGVWLHARVISIADDGVALEWVDPRVDYLAILLTERTT
jgi:hypothetical protein